MLPAEAVGELRPGAGQRPTCQAPEQAAVGHAVVVVIVAVVATDVPAAVAGSPSERTPAAEAACPPPEGRFPQPGVAGAEATYGDWHRHRPGANPRQQAKCWASSASVGAGHNLAGVSDVTDVADVADVALEQKRHLQSRQGLH